MTTDSAEYDRSSLFREYQNLYGKPPPVRMSSSILALAIAYKNQEMTLGELKPALLRRLLFHVPIQSRTSPSTPNSAPRSIKPGTVLLREWQGLTYTVQIIEEGVVFQGKTYRSLSQVARRITGQRWSGPRFFGLLGPRLRKRKPDEAQERLAIETATEMGSSDEP